MIINSAKFVTSSPEVEKCPADGRHEYAFIGRSNVGKSSLINMLTGKKGLAMTSSTPGKTMLINHFLVNDSWYIVDLPGYGYARRSKADRARLEAMIKSYILQRTQMTNLFVLIDSRLEPQKIDLEFMEWLGENGVPFSIVFTKLDKQSPRAGKTLIARYLEKLLETWDELPPVFRTSSEDRRGRDALLNYIEEMNRLPLAVNSAPWPVVSDSEINKNTSEMKPKGKNTKSVKTAAEYPGVSIDIADSEKVDSELVKERTHTLDNNPRDNS